MSDIEERSGRGQSAGGVAGAGGGEWLCSHVMKCQTFQSSLLFDVINNRVLCEPVPPDSRLANFSLRVKGGILAGKLTCSLLYSSLTVSDCLSSELCEHSAS